MELAEADPEWTVGFLDECWWSRVALPTLNAWAEEDKPPRLIQRSVATDDPEPKAISCYGVFLSSLDETWIRFVDGRPVSSITRGGSFRGALRDSKRWARRSSFSSGTTLPGTSPRR
jgi:hypothetical protein